MRSFAKCYAKIIVLSTTLLLMAGCLEFGERLEIGRDGSATIHVQLRITSAFQNLVRGNPAFSAFALLMDPEAFEASLPAGLTLRRHTHTGGSGRQTYLNELYAPDARNIRMGDSAAFSGQRFEIEMLADGSLRYTRHLDFTEAAKDPDLAKMIAENRMGINAILRSAPFVFRMSSPLPVLSTNGKQDGNTVVWEYALYDLLHNPVVQQVHIAAPTLLDKIAGAARMLFQTRYYPIFAVLLLGLFFLLTRRPKLPASGLKEPAPLS
jgi:hypothetical protein